MLYKKPTAKLCSLKSSLILFQNQLFLEKPRASLPFTIPSVAVPSDISAHGSQYCLLPSPKKPNHQSEEIKSDFRSPSICSVRQEKPENYQCLEKTMGLCQHDSRLTHMGIKVCRPTSACRVPGTSVPSWSWIGMDTLQLCHSAWDFLIRTLII